MSNAVETVAVAERVAAEIAAVEALLVEVPGESREKRYQRVRRLSERLENLRGGYQPWSAESKALGDAIGRVFRFRAFGK